MNIALIAIIIIESILILFLTLLVILFRKEIQETKDELYIAKKDWISIKSTLQMATYFITQYREGKNPYTVMSKIIDLFRDEL